MEYSEKLNLLEEIDSINLRIESLKLQKEQVLEKLEPFFYVKEGQESTITNIDDFVITKKTFMDYKLDKKKFYEMEYSKKEELKILGIVKDDIKLYTSNLKKNLETHTDIMAECITANEKTTLTIKRGE